jgi:hypothetical protein
MTDQQAIERYQYLLRTAPPEAIEQAHEEAFATLTPQQRRAVLEQLATATPPGERSALKDDPHSLARAATRAEIRRPGFLERTFGAAPAPGFSGGPGWGSTFGSSFLAGFAGTVVGSAIAHHFFDADQHAQGLFDSHDQAAVEDAAAANDSESEIYDDLGGDSLGDDFDGGDLV